MGTEKVLMEKMGELIPALKTRQARLEAEVQRQAAAQQASAASGNKKKKGKKGRK
jgi:hypothetical protein